MSDSGLKPGGSTWCRTITRPKEELVIYWYNGKTPLILLFNRDWRRHQLTILIFTEYRVNGLHLWMLWATLHVTLPLSPSPSFKLCIFIYGILWSSAYAIICLWRTFRFSSCKSTYIRKCKPVLHNIQRQSEYYCLLLAFRTSLRCLCAHTI